MEPVTTVVGNFEHIVYTTNADLKIDTLRPINAQPEHEFRPASVTDEDGKELWRYQKGRHPDAFSILRDVDDVGFVIGYANWRNLFEVIVVNDLPKMRLVRDTNGRDVYEGGPGAQVLIELKELLAKDMKLEPVFSPTEMVIVKIIRQRQAEERLQAEAQERAAAAAAQQERERQRQARIATILARPILQGFTTEGQRLTGVPVVGDEYLLVPSGRWVIAVQDYDDQHCKAGPMIGHFLVRKSGGGKVYKDHLRPVMEDDPSVPKPTTLRQEELIFEFNGAFDIISLYTREGIQSLHASGLNGGAKVGLFPKNPDGTVTIFEVVKKEVREFGRFMPITA